MRKTLRRASCIRRWRKRIRVGALTAPSTIIQRNSPLLATAEIKLRLARLWQTLVANPNHRCPAARGIATAAHVIRAQSGLVTPEDHPPSLPGPRHNGRVAPPQPAPHRRWVLLKGPPDRLLRREPPARQVLAHRAHGQFD